MRQRGPGSAFRDWDGVEFEHGTVWGSVPQLDFTVAVGDARLEKALVAGDEERPNLLLRQPFRPMLGRSGLRRGPASLRFDEIYDWRLESRRQKAPFPLASAPWPEPFRTLSHRRLQYRYA
jgi:hypothetical protein